MKVKVVEVVVKAAAICPFCSLPAIVGRTRDGRYRFTKKCGHAIGDPADNERGQLAARFSEDEV